MRLLWVAVVTAALSAAWAAPAVADPARPTNFRSTVTGVEPAFDGFHLEIMGGDAYVVATGITTVALAVGVATLVAAASVLLRRPEAHHPRT